MRKPGYLLASVAPSSNPADTAIKVLVVVGAGLPVCELFSHLWNNGCGSDFQNYQRKSAYRKPKPVPGVRRSCEPRNDPAVLTETQQEIRRLPLSRYGCHRKFSLEFSGAPTGNLSLSMGSDTSIFNTTTALSQFFAWKNTTAAVVGTSRGSPVNALCGRAFHGSMDVEDGMTLSELPAMSTTQRLRSRLDTRVRVPEKSPLLFPDRCWVQISAPPQA